MRSILKSFRSLVFLIVFAITFSGIITIPAFTQPVESKILQHNSITICEDCYIVHVWINGIRWAEVYDADGKMVDMYPDPED